MAAWAVQGLTEPEMTGLGGDMFMLIYLAKTGEVKFINGTGVAPMAATVDFYKGKGGLPERRHALGQRARRGGRRGVRRKDVWHQAAVGIDGARRGARRKRFPDHRVARRSHSQQHRQVRTVIEEDLVQRRPPARFGDRVVQKDLATTLREIGAKGSAAFYQGPIAHKFAAYMKAQGGLIDRERSRGLRANEDTPIKINYKGIDVYECPPNSQGHVMLQALNILEGMNVRYMRHNSAPYLHAVTESLKLSFADRNKWVGDPKFTPPIPMREMLSKEYAAIRRALIDPDRAIDGEAPAGDPRGRRRPASSRSRMRGRRPRPIRRTVDTAEENGHTTYLAVVDKDRNMVSITSSLLSLFGSGHVVEGAGFLLNNRMAYFGLDEDDVNVLRPGEARAADDQSGAGAERRQAVHGVRHARRGHAAAGAAAVLPERRGVRHERAAGARAAVDRQHGVQELVLSARGRGNVAGSRTFPQHVLDELASMGHKLDVRNVRGVGSVKAIIIHPKTGVLMGGVSPTRDSYVMAY